MSEVSAFEKARLNPCCKSLSEKCSKLLEGRNALRKAVKLLEEQVDKIQQDNANLKKECEEESARKEKELSARMSLENEVSDLKSEILLLHQRESSDTEGKDREIGLLRQQLSETNKLKELLEIEKKRVDAEKKNADTEKRRADEAHKRVKAEKAKAVEENKYAVIERKRAEGYRVQLEALKKQAGDLNSLLISEKEEKERHLAIMTSLENEVSVLQSEISCLKKECAGGQQKEKEYMLLKDRVSEGEEEISKLRELLEKYMSTPDFVAKVGEEETESVTKTSKQLNSVRSNTEEENNCACIDENKVRECLAQLEAFRKALEDENMKFLLGKEGKNVESDIGALEMIISVLMSEIFALKKVNANVEDRENEIKGFQQDIDGREHETEIVNEHVEKPKKIEVFVDKTRELETQVAFEIPEKPNEENAGAKIKHGGYFENKAEDSRLQFQALMKEIEGTKSMLSLEREDYRREVARRVSLEEEIIGLKSQICWLQQKRAEDIHGEIEILKGSLDRKEEELGKLKELVDKVKLQLDSEKKKVEVQKKIADEACDRLKAEKFKVLVESKNASYEAKKAEKFWIQLDFLKKDFLKVQSELCSEKEKFSKMQEELEVEQQNLLKARQLVEAEISKADHQKELAEVNGKMAVKEKARADELSCQLELYKHKNEELRKQMQQFLHYRNIAEVPGTLPAEKDNIKLTKMKLLKKQLKLERMQLKHAKQVAEFEKYRNSILQQELGNMRHDFVRISSRFDLLAKCFSPNNEGISDMKKDGALGDMHHQMMRRNRYDVEPCQMYTKKGIETFYPDYTATAKGNLLKQPSTSSPVCAGDPSLSTSGIVSQSFHGGSNTKLLVDSSTHASSASFSDGELVTSQDRVEIVGLSKKVVGDNSNAQPTFHFKSDKDMLNQILNGQNDLCDKPERLHKRRKVSPENEPDAASPNDTSIGVAQACEDTVRSSVKTVPDTLLDFEDIADVDYMKLLELDNSDEEEIFKKAMDMPLSPTLPEISIPEALVLSDVPRNTLHKEALAPDIINVEHHGNDSRGHGCKASHEGSRHANEDVVAGVYSQSHEAEKASNGCSENCGYEVKTAHIAAFFVISSVEDSSSIYRVFSATKVCMAHCAVNIQVNSMLQRILDAVGIQEKLSSIERGCVLFTLLLLNFSECKLVKFGRISYMDLIADVDSLSRDLQPVLSTAEGRSSFEEVCSLYELLGIIGDFLVNGTVVECTNSASEMLNECNSRADDPSEEELKLFRKTATIEQMMVGSTLLSSICRSAGYIGFVCETSYDLVRKSRCDTSSLLTILHVFAYVVGEQYFSLNDCCLTMNVLKSIVGWLEGKKRSLVSSENTIELQFICCTTCPFGAVSLDVITSVLLEKLWSSSEDLRITHRMESTSLSNSRILRFEHNGVEEAISWSKSIMNGTVGDTSNILSLLELVTCKMGWKCTHSKVIPELLEMMERPVSSTFKIAVIIFLGEVGRIGVAASGYEDKGVESLRYELCSFLGRQIVEKAAVFPVQIATVTSLLRLLSLDLQSVVDDESFKCSTTNATSQSAVIRLLRDWFSSLSKDGQTMSLSFLQYIK
ncbi:hypothetical protein LINPERPRIM_LOCUS19846 [Linum perenne]